MSSSVATYDDVVQAARRMRGRLHKTQVAESLALNNLCGARVLVKCEALQRTGTFKFRGALNRILRLSAAEREAGVVAFSSGNFGQGLAAAAQAEHVQCIIVMPGDAPENKQVTTLLRYSFQKFEPTRVVGPGSQLWSYSGS
eukprot:m.117395 g.117395  ORF g.117395 m.117395 type:complete len:142 (+) comp14250_c0_seq3:35-460(+)